MPICLSAVVCVLLCSASARRSVYIEHFLVCDPHPEWCNSTILVTSEACWTQNNYSGCDHEAHLKAEPPHTANQALKLRYGNSSCMELCTTMTNATENIDVRFSPVRLSHKTFIGSEGHLERTTFSSLHLLSASMGCFHRNFMVLTYNQTRMLTLQILWNAKAICKDHRLYLIEVLPWLCNLCMFERHIQSPLHR